MRLRKIMPVEFIVVCAILSVAMCVLNPALAQEFTRTIATATNISLPIVNSTDNVSFATGANNTKFYISKQTGEAAFGAWAAAGANISIIGTSGVYNFPLNATEMNNTRVAILYNETGCLQQFSVINTVVQATIDVIDGIVDDILTDTGTTLPATLAAQTNVTLAGTQAFNVTGNMLGNVTAVTNNVTVTNCDVATSTRGTSNLTTSDNIGINWADVANPTTAVNLSGTNIKTDQVVASVSGAVGSVTGAVGSVTGGVTVTTNNDKTGYTAAISNGGITSGSFGAGAIDANAIATDAIGANELAQAAADKSWGTTTRTLTALDEDDTTIDIDASTAPGTVEANLVQINGTAIAGTGSQVAAGFEHYFNVETPSKTMNDAGGESSLTAQNIRDAMKLAPSAGAATAGSIDDQLADLQTDLDNPDQYKADVSGCATTPQVAAVQAAVDSVSTDTGTTIPGLIGALNDFDPASDTVKVSELQASALADMFNTDSGTTYASAVAGSPVKETADNAGSGSSDWTAGERADILEALGVDDGTATQTLDTLYTEIRRTRGR